MTTVVNDRARIPLARGRFHAAVVAGSPGLRESLARVLTTLGAADVTTAGLLGEARTLGRGTPTSLAVVECQLPDGSGVDATRAILDTLPAVRVLVMTMSDDDEAVVASMRAGARGYVIKGTGRDDVLHAVRTVAGGGAVFSPAVADRLGGLFGSLAAVPGKVAFPSLTAREREVLDLLAAGRTNAQIAAALFLSPKTVRNNVSNVFAKLQVAGRSEAIVRARDAGLGR